MHRKGGHQTFLGMCEWFPLHDRPPKAITLAVVDVGCKFHEPHTETCDAAEVFINGQPVGEFFTEGMSDKEGP